MCSTKWTPIQAAHGGKWPEMGSWTWASYDRMMARHWRGGRESGCKWRGKKCCTVVPLFFMACGGVLPHRPLGRQMSARGRRGRGQNRRTASRPHAAERLTPGWSGGSWLRDQGRGLEWQLVGVGLGFSRGHHFDGFWGVSDHVSLKSLPKRGRPRFEDLCPNPNSVLLSLI